jgi:manganese transport protein
MVVPLARALGPVGLAVGLLGFLATTIAAAAECTLSVGYSVAQYFGWSWGKDRRPADAPRFQLVRLAALVAAAAFILTSIDPVMLTIVSVVLGRWACA